jgi:hypothetical protein
MKPPNKCGCTMTTCSSCRNGGTGRCTCTLKQCGHCKRIRADEYGKCSCHPR